MAATKAVLMGGAFQDGLGNVLANGYLTMKLSQDAAVSGVGIICSGIEITINLDVNGNVVSSPAQSVWANTGGVLSPVNTFYKVTGYTAKGQRAFGPSNQQVAAGATFNLGSWVPNQVIQWFPTIGATPLAVEVRGAAFSSTTLLNFESSDSSVTITDEGSGLLNFQGNSLSLEVNSTPNADQELLNLTAGSNISITDAGAGEIIIAAMPTTFGTAGVGGFFSAGFPMTSMYGTAISGTTVGAIVNQVTVFQFTLSTQFIISRISCYVTVGQTSATVNFGIYDSTGHRLLDSGALTASSSSTTESTTITPVTLPPGTYYFAQSSSNTGVQVTGFTNVSPPWEEMINAHGSVKVGQAANSTSAGVMPTTLGIITADVSEFLNMAGAFFAV